MSAAALLSLSLLDMVLRKCYEECVEPAEVVLVIAMLGRPRIFLDSLVR